MILGTRFLVSFWRYGGQTSTFKLGLVLEHLEQLHLAHEHTKKQNEKHQDALLTGRKHRGVSALWWTGHIMVTLFLNLYLVSYQPTFTLIQIYLQ